MIKILFKHDNPLFKNRIAYVLRFLEQHPLLGGRIAFIENENEHFDQKLFYGIEKGDAGYIPSQKVIFSKVLPVIENLCSNTYEYQQMQLYAFELKRRKPAPFIIEKHFQVDLIETIFFHITRFEEWFYQKGREDVHQRMASKHQFLVKHQLHHLPVVDHLVLAFGRAMGLSLENIPTRFRMTHDIDAVHKNNSILGKLRTSAAAILKMRDIDRAKKVVNNQSENPFDTFDYLLLDNKEIEKNIYFLVGGKTRYDTPYDLNDSIVQDAFKHAKKKGYKIGIHPSYDSLKNKSLFVEEIKKLETAIGETISVTRQHYLRFSFQHTATIIDELGLKEDSSLGFADRIGFRCGTGFPYHLYDFKNEQPFQFLEVPLVFMESALLAEANFNAELFEQIWIEFLAKNTTNTMITFNFHNSRFYDAALSGIDLKTLYLGLFLK